MDASNEQPIVQQALLDSQRAGGDNNPGSTQQENVQPTATGGGMASGGGTVPQPLDESSRMDASNRLQNWENEQRIDTIAPSKRLEFPQFQQHELEQPIVQQALSQQHELEQPIVQQALLDSQRGASGQKKKLLKVLRGRSPPRESKPPPPTRLPHM